jgi:murein DD-endopeptidase MepM/ murein hydrolase activator NlpD
VRSVSWGGEGAGTIRLRIAVSAAILAALVLPAVGAPTVARAQTDEQKQQQINDQIDSLKSQVSEASAEEANLLNAIDASNARKKELDAKVADIDGQIAGVQRNLNAAEAKLSSAQSAQQGAEDRLTSAQRALVDAKNKLANYAVAAYTGQSDAVQFLTVTLQSRSMDELVAKRSYMQAVGNNQSETILLAEHLRNQVKDLTAQLTEATQAAQVQADAVATQKVQLQAVRDTQAAAQAQVQAEINNADQLRQEVVAKKDDFLAQEEDLQKQSDAITAQLQARAAAQAAAAQAAAANGGNGSGPSGASGPSAAPAAASAPSASGFIMPLDGNPPITSPFGYRVHPIYGTTLLHTGVDFGADTGTPIHAAASGVVVSAGWIDGYGNATIIDHGSGLATLYGHQSALLVSSGQHVTQGQTIGRVGCTGSCTGPHLHFEVRVNGTPVDPMPYLP